MSREGPRYSPRVLELFAALPGGGDLPEGPGAAVAGEAMALDRGAWVRFEARVERGRIADCAFRAWGCPHTLAAAAFASQAVRGRGLEEAERLGASRLVSELAVPVEKTGRMLVVEDALRALVGQARRIQ